MSSMQPFDVTEHLRQQVRGVIVGSIPDDEMDKMIRAEFERFFRGRERSGYSEPSPFRQLVESLLREQMVLHVKSWLGANFQSTWDEVGGEKLIGPMVAELAPLVQAKLAADITSATLANFRNSLNTLR